MAKQTFTTGQVLLASQLTSLQQTAMLGGAASAKTASYTLVAADAGTAISMTSTSATTITVNTGLFADGDTVQITNLGTGVCTITAGTATVNTSASLALAQYESGTLDFTSTSAAIFIKGAGAAPASGEKSILVAQDSTQYIKYFSTAVLSTSASATEDVTYYFPIYLPNYALDRISLRTGAVWSGTTSVRLGLYNADATTGKPSTVYLDAGTVSCTAINTNYEITISTTPPAGYYYFAFNAQTAPAGDFTGFTTTAIPLPFTIPTSSTPQNVNYNRRYEQTGVTGAFATAGTLTLSTTAPLLVAVRIA